MIQYLFTMEESYYASRCIFFCRSSFLLLL